MNTLGVVESRNIAAGVMLADGMIKAARVELVRASTICAGRYLIFVSGETDAVAASVNFAKSSAYSLIGSFVISNISPQIPAALKNSLPGCGGAIGVVECRNVSSGLAAADKSVKKAAVRLLRLVTGQGITGKSYFVLEGDIASVTEAVEEAKGFLADRLIEAIILPAPDESVVRAVTGRAR